MKGAIIAEQSNREQLFQAEKSRRERRANVLLVVLAMLVLFVAFFSLMLGKYPINPTDIFGLLASKLAIVPQTWTDQQAALFFNVRLPRVLLALMVGCSLSAAGAAYQGTFQNPLVSPDILGASQGAAFGAAVGILLGVGAFGVSLSAFAFSIAAVLLVLLVSMRAKGHRVLIVVLAGVMISSLLQAGVSFTKLVADPTDQLPAITYWLMGSLTSADMDDVAFMLPPTLIGCAVLFALRWKINILTMGDEEAATMGVDARRIRVVVIAAATLVTAASVAVSGIIGWVGLVVPHLCRMSIGADYRKLMPASMLMGAGFLLVVDDFARMVATSEIPLGILTAFIGAPFFLYLITRKKKL